MDRDRDGDKTVQLPGHTRTIDNADTVAGEPPSSPSVTRDELVVDIAHPRYHVDAVIGRGGMGEVVTARDEQIGRSVAIKRMRADTPSPEAVARFVREARIQGRLDHPAVVPVHELWRDGRGRPVFAMKQLSGTNLEDVLRQVNQGDAEATARYPRQRLLRVFSEVCLAIEFAHSRGVIHRDLKPANIMLGEFGEVYVLDWGIARVYGEPGERAISVDIDPVESSVTMAGAVLGTPGYMAPEQIEGRLEIDGRVDVYALGCILFEILAGEPAHPLGTKGLASTLGGIDGRPSARRTDRDVPPELDVICAAATARDREARTATTRQLGDAVQRYLDGDRDVELRRKLARGELATARAALDGGDSEASRRIAMRSAAQALALDPYDPGARELVGRLMLEPPATVPDEVEQQLDRVETNVLRANGRLGIAIVPAYVLFFPALYLAGFRGTWYFIAGPAIIAGLFALSWRLAHAPTRPVVYGIVAANTALIALLSRVTSPFLFAPPLAVINTMIFAMHPRTGPRWVVWAAMSVAVLAPWWLELAGVVSTTTAVDGNRLVLTTAAGALDPLIVKLGLAVYTLATVGAATIIARDVALNRRIAQRAVELQSWQLRQLVPAAPTPADQAGPRLARA